MNTIDAIKENLRYSNAQEQERAYASWFTVVAILADAYADERMEKEETICRWVVRQRKIPKVFKGKFYWLVARPIYGEGDYSHRLPLIYVESVDLELDEDSSLLGCLDRLIAIPEQYLDRFR